MKSVTRFWSHEAQNIRCVREADYDAALGQIAALEQSEKLAQETVTLALSTGLRVSRENKALQQRLTVQDQREDDMKSLLRVALLAVEDMEEVHGDNGDTSSARSMRDLVDKINAAIKPAAEAESHE